MRMKPSAIHVRDLPPGDIGADGGYMIASDAAQKRIEESMQERVIGADDDAGEEKKS